MSHSVRFPRRTGRLFVALLAAALTTAAFAGGPIYTFDYANQIPYAWNMTSWPDNEVPIYTDLGNLGIISNARANEMAVFAANQWSSVPTSSFRANVWGDFSLISQGDIDYYTIGLIVGQWNGGGIDIVYDNDGSIMQNFFGVPPTSVLGITDIDFAAVGTPEILEAWMVISGPGVRSDDPNGVAYQGVFTHEMGHALNLAHTQVNGWSIYAGQAPQPAGCGAPWTGMPSPMQSETMAPYTNPEPGGTGEYQGTVDQLDDMSALSDLYPAPGYPDSRATISGQVLDTNGNPVGSVNIVARNVANPFGDASSKITGQVSKQQAGPDGSFVLTDLTPGGRYVVYVESLKAGGFSVPRWPMMPGPEEYWNGQMESSDAAIDDRCQWVTVDAQQGAPASVEIDLQRYTGAPVIITMPANGNATAITRDGSTVVGALGNKDVFRWDLNSGTLDDIGGYVWGNVGISDDGTRIVADAYDTDGSLKAGIYENGAWTVLPPGPGTAPCTQDGPPTYNGAENISGDGSTVVGLSYNYCDRGSIRAYKWTAAGGSVVLPKFSSPNNMSRANAANFDGSVIVGLDESSSGVWRAAYWKNGVVKLMTRNSQPVNNSTQVSRDGLYAVGQSSFADLYNAYRFNTSTATVEMLGILPGQTNSITWSINDDHGVIAGTSDADNGRVATIWTPGLHWSSFYTFLSSQGVNVNDIGFYGVASMSGDGTTMVGTMTTRVGDVGFALKSPTSIVCHAQQTTVVAFPHGLDSALAAGDTLGPCQCYLAAPTGVPTLTVEKPSPGIMELIWNSVDATSSYDVVRGSLSVLHATKGDFSQATTDCLENDLNFTARDDADTPNTDDGFWYLVRANSCGGHATYDSGAPSQVGSRDAGIQAAPATCP